MIRHWKEKGLPATWSPRGDTFLKFYLTDKQIEKVLKLADTRISSNPELRYGQAVWNALWELFENTAKQIRGTQLDCFYDDKLVLPLLFFINIKNKY